MSKFVIVIIILVIVLVVGAIISSPIIAYSTDVYVEDIVKEKERITKRDSSKYLIFGETETYENTDSLWYWKWNSSDIYGDLEEGKTYRLRVYGWRIPFMSWYRNIIEIEEI